MTAPMNLSYWVPDQAQLCALILRLCPFWRHDADQMLLINYPMRHCRSYGQ